MSDSDAEWLAAAKSGDSEAIEALLLACGRRLREELSGQIGRHWQSVLSEDDVIQVTYVEAFVHFRCCQATELTGFMAWLRRIAENNLRDAISGLEAEKRPNPRRRLDRVRDSDESAASLLEVLVGTSATPSRLVSAAESRSLLEQAIDRLPERYSAVVRICDLQSVSAVEAAAVLGCSPGAVHMRRARAHDYLKSVLPSMSAFYSGSS